MKATEKKLRWFVVLEDGWYLVGARSHSRAKIQWGYHISGNYSAFESLQLRCKLFKGIIPREPIEEGDIFDGKDDNIEDIVFLHP